MLEENREVGDILVGQELREILKSLRATEGVTTEPTLEIEALRDLERGVGWRLPSQILATAAAGLTILEKSWAFSLSKIVGHTGQVRAKGATGDLVGIGKKGNELFLCIKKGEAEDPENDLRLTLFDTETKTSTQTTLYGWLKDVLAERKKIFADAMDDPAIEQPAEPSGVVYCPMIVRKLPEGSPGQEVVHKSFGTGRVLREIGKGPTRKVQVDFPGKGLKLIQARFLQWLE